VARPKDIPQVHQKPRPLKTLKEGDMSALRNAGWTRGSRPDAQDQLQGLFNKLNGWASARKNKDKLGLTQSHRVTERNRTRINH